MVDISSQNNKVNITVSSSGNTANTNVTPDYTKYYSDKSKEWAISDKIIDNTDYSSKYYANESKKQADISTAKATEVVEGGNTAVSNIENAKDNAITDITNQETISKTNLIEEGTTQINLAKEQVTLATNQANIATEQATIATTQAGIATSKTTEVVESGNTALSNIETAKSNALNDINTTGAGYVNNAEQYAQNALNSANNAKSSEDNALSYKNSAMESSQTATEQASIAVTNANKAITSANNAKTSETNAKSSETRCEEILSRLGTAIKIKGRVDSLSDLPSSGNLDGDTYLVGEEGLDSYPEYYWYQDHWEFMGTTTSLTWGSIVGDITSQTDLKTALDSKQDIISDLATIRSGASKGATALQSVPAEYVTETELESKGYLTEHQDISGKANTDLSNLSNSGKKVIDGQWVAKKETLSTAKAIGTYIIDLSSYLPNDNYNYEVFLHVSLMQKSATSTTHIAIVAGGVSIDFVRANSASIYATNSAVFPVDNTRKIELVISTKNADYNSLTAFYYRRIGTNQ